MPYAQVSDITGLAPGVELTATSKPTAGQVQIWIGDVERDLNAQLTNLGYVTPVIQASSPIAFAILRDKVAHAVLARVLRARAFGSSDPKAQGADAAEMLYQHWLKQLRDVNDPTELPDVPRTGEAVEKDSADRTASNFATETPQLEGIVGLGTVF